MKKIVAIIVMSAILIAIVAGCKPAVTTSEVVLPDGFRSDGEFSGGRTVRDSNAYSCTASQESDTYTITLEFAVGSTINGVVQSDSHGIPKYTAKLVNTPQRIIVEFPELCYADCMKTMDITSCSEIVRGCFEVNNGVSGATSICFQLKCDAAFSVEEEGNSLKLHLVRHPNQANEDSFDYYVTANVDSRQSAGKVDVSSDLTPTMTLTDGAIVYISAPMASQNDANALLSELKQRYSDDAGRFEVIALYKNSLPIFNRMLDYTQVYDEKPIRVKGEALGAEVFLPDGIFLAASPDDEILYSVLSAGDEAHQSLWIKNDDGCERLLRFEFENIERAEYSPDGRKLAVLENSASGSHLYVFDTYSRELLVDLSDAGFGKRISGFAWDDNGTAIYAIGGTDSIQIHMYDFCIADDTKRASVVYSGNVDESSIAFVGGELYFVSTDEEGSTIYSVRPEGGVRQEFAKGSAFMFSSNGEFVVITTASTVASTDEYEFYMLDMSTGEKNVITSEFPVYEFIWSYTDEEVAYIEDRLSGNDDYSGDGEVEETPEATAMVPTDAYPYTIHLYERSSKSNSECCDVKFSGLYVYKRDLCVPYYDAETLGEVVRATYVASSRGVG